MNIFFTPDISSEKFRLSKEESLHCIKVLRLRNGDEVSLVDGKGGFYQAKIIDENPKSCELQIVNKVSDYGQSDYSLTVAIAPTKNIDRFEWFLEKTTEIGISAVCPILCKRSERKEIKLERLRKVMVSAMKQSLKAYLPELFDLKSIDSLISAPFDGDKFIAHCADGEKILLKDKIVSGRNVLILIGPEGDFTEEEIQMALRTGFIPVSLGDSRLRTETAGIVACHTVSLINQK